ncbi:MAG: VOC family protein [Jatrophihabitans sp.]|uniref:VOC family protein n=1 Tax=Jatrophihabitans sp. TaxID=1932789 RepID=UPI003F7FF6C0
MRILGLCFAGTATPQREAMRSFVTDVLGLPPVIVGGMGADAFTLPDGSVFAVASPGEMGETHRSIGFLVDDLDEALGELRAAGVETDDEVSENDRMRYAHFVAPDGGVYELVEQRRSVVDAE